MHEIPFKTVRTPFRKNRFLHVLLILYIAIWGWLAIHPTDRKDWLIENILIVLFIGFLAIQYRSFTFSSTSYLLMTIFLILHTIGAHYSYQGSPVDEFAKHFFGFKRGIYDRLVHFFFGALLSYPLMEYISRKTNLTSRWIMSVTFTFLAACGMIYEIIEMIAALIAEPKLAAKFLGLQGDPLDTQKDMGMNVIGTIVSIIIIWLIGRSRR